MKNVLNKRIPREFKGNLGRYICIFLLLTTTVMLGASFLAVLDSVTLSLNDNQENKKVEDGQFETVLEIDDEAKEELEEEGIQLVENFYSTEKEYEENAKIQIFSERKDMNIVSLFEGKMPVADEEIVLDRLFAFNRKINIGDTIELNDVSYKVVGTVALPDYNSLFKSNQDVVMNTTDFGVAVTTNEGFERFDEDTLTYRYSYRLNDRNLTKKEKLDKASDLTEILRTNGAMLQSFTIADNNQSITYLKEDMGHDGPVMKVFVYILIGIIAFVFAVLTNNTIEAEATIIGTLRASGYKKREIIAHYMAPTLIMAVVGSIIGNALGYTVMIEPLTEIYYTSYCLPPFELHFNLEGFISTTVLPVVIMVLINWFMLYRKMSLSPLRFLRGDLRKSKQRKAVKLPNFSFLNRFRLRVLIQNKSSYIILFTGIFLSSFLLMFGIGLMPLLEHYVDKIDESLPYEYQYILKAPADSDNGEKMSTYSLDLYYPLAKNNIATTFMGIEEDSEYFDFIELPQNKKDIVITKPLAKKVGIKIGDEITFNDSFKDKNYTLKVVSIADYDATLGAFMSMTNLNDLLDVEEDYFNSYISNEKLDIEDAYIAKFITRTDLIGAADQMMVSFRGVMSVVTIFSVLIYIVLIYLLTKTVIDRNAIHISFMKVFGYENGEINKLYLNATTITVLASLFICIPIEVLSFQAILIYLSCLMEGYISFYLPLYIYIEIIVIGVVAYFSINALHIHRVRKIPMSLALKSRE